MRYLAASFLSLLSVNSWAIAVQDWYLLGGVGYAQVTDAAHNDAFFQRSVHDLLQNNPVKSAPNHTKEGLLLRIGSGLWLTEHLGIEFNYQSVNTENNYQDGVYTFNNIALAEQTTSVGDWQMFEVSGIGRYFLTQKFSTFARAGVAWTEKEYTSEVFALPSNGGGSGSPLGEEVVKEQHEMGGVFSAGVQYDINEFFGVRVEANTVQFTAHNNMNAVSANIVLNIGSILYGVK